jgi:hypothetical protein
MTIFHDSYGRPIESEDAPRIPVSLRYEHQLGKWVAESDLYICAAERRIDAMAELCRYHNVKADAFDITVDES